jgi:hypothetical protein
MARAVTRQRRMVHAFFISEPVYQEVGPEDRFEVGKVYEISAASLARWENLGRARAATDEEIAAAGLQKAVADIEPIPVAPNSTGHAPILAQQPSTGTPPPPMPQTVMDTSGAAGLLEAVDTMTFFAFKAEAKKILGDATPAGKADIIAALKALVPATE